MNTTQYWTLDQYLAAYQAGQTPRELLAAWFEHAPDDAAWISRATMHQLEGQIQELESRVAGHPDLTQWPLYGVPIAVKDNIDVAGFATTAACAAFEYWPEHDAAVVTLLRQAGAIIVGKTNLDQFATGLVGTRSPWGEVPNTFKPDYVSGGSSSGSASVVARGWVPIALGTDTAGSGRVPAGFNNIVGLKGTLGAISVQGVVPACQTLDCVSIFALTLADASQVFDWLAQRNQQDPWSRSKPAHHIPQQMKRLGIPQAPNWFGDARQAQAWADALAQWQTLPVTLVPIDFTLLWELAALLYEGPWVAERHAAIAEFMAVAEQRTTMHSTVRDIIAGAEQFSATDYFKAHYQKQSLIHRIQALLAEVDGLLVPTSPCFPTRAAVAANPISENAKLGLYTNFVNLSDRCALSVPAGMRSDGLPFGVTLIAEAWRDQDLQALASQWLALLPLQLGNGNTPWPEEALQLAAAELPDQTVEVCVVGAHLEGMPLHSQLTERRAQWVEATTTAPCYRLFELPDSAPPKPGLARMQTGVAIAVEVYRMGYQELGSLMALIPPPLGIGNVQLADGRWVKGFICEPLALEAAKDISHFGGWRAFMAAHK